MSTRYIWRNDMYAGPLQPDGSATGQIGTSYYRSSTGGNQVKGQPLTPHPYSLTLQARGVMLFKQQRCNPMNTNWYGTIEPSCTLTRAWGNSDTYSLYGKLEEAYDKGDFNAGVFTGELGETVDLLAERTKQLARAALAAKHGNFAKAAKILVSNARSAHKIYDYTPKKSRRRRLMPPDRVGPQDPSRVSDYWLELQYGWRPLLSDIYSLSDQISQMDKPRKRRISARKSIPYKVNTSPYFETSGGGRYSKQIVAYITEDIPSWPQALGLMDPEIVAWELVPFSFVADWFIPIGNYLQARSFASRAKGTFVLTTYDHWTARVGAAKRIVCADGSGFSIPLGLGYQQWVSVERTVQASLPAVPLPSFSNGIGGGNRLANAVALVASIFGKKIGVSR